MQIYSELNHIYRWWSLVLTKDTYKRPIWLYLRLHLEVNTIAIYMFCSNTNLPSWIGY